MDELPSIAPQAGPEGEPKDDETTTLFDAAYDCLVLFDGIREKLEGPNGERALKPSDDDSSPLARFSGLRNSFLIWAGYTGALSLQKSSLDARLKQYPDISRMIIELLDMVRRNLSPDSEQGLALDEIISRYEDVEDVSPDKSADMEDTFKAIEDALEHLQFLATAIRNSSVKRLQYDLNSFLGDEDGLFLNDMIAYVRRKYPGARKALCVQLGESIAIRRQMILQKRRHARKLAKRRPVKNQDQSQPRQSQQEQPENQAKPETPSRKGPEKQPQPQQPAAARNSVPSSYATEASRPDPRNLLTRQLNPRPKTKLSSVRSATPSVADDSLEYPEPPKASAGDKHVPCPYCMAPLDTKALKTPGSTTWHRHVDQDLQPYVCLFPQCSKALVFFGRLQEWREHMENAHSEDWMQRVHTLTFFCDFDHPQQQQQQQQQQQPEPLQFQTQDELREHFQDPASHPGRFKKPLTKAQLDLLASRRQKPVPRDPFVCPLCENVPREFEHLLGKLNKQDLADLAVRHVAQHIKSLSFMSLPSRDGGLGAEAEAQSSVQEDGSSRKRMLRTGSEPDTPSQASDFERLSAVSLTFDDDSHEKDTEKHGEEEHLVDGLDTKDIWRDILESKLAGEPKDHEDPILKILSEQSGRYDYLNASPPTGREDLLSVPTGESKSGDTTHWQATQGDRRQVLDWLRPLDFDTPHKKLCDEHEPGTLRWFLRTQKYLDWSKSVSDGTARRALLCHGLPGTGKSVLTAFLVEHIKRHGIGGHPGPNIGIAHVYFNVEEYEAQSSEAVLASLVHQLTLGQAECPESLLRLYDSHRINGSRPSVMELVQVLEKLCSLNSATVIFLDALDQSNTLDPWLRALLDGRFTNIFATSRHVTGICEEFDEEMRIHLEPMPDDIDAYVQARLPDAYRAPKVADMYEMECARVKSYFGRYGLFLFRNFVFGPRDNGGHNSSSTLEEDFQRAFLDARDALFKQAMAPVLAKDPGQRVLAFAYLNWIVFAERELMPEELLSAVAKQDGTPFSRTASDVVEICAGTVSHNRESGKLEFFHPQAIPWLQNPRISPVPGGFNGTSIARSCVDYLSSRQFKGGACGSELALEARLRRNPLYRYAAIYWSRHVSRCDDDNELLLQKTMDFLDDEEKVQAATQVLFLPRNGEDVIVRGYSQSYPRGFGKLHLTAYLGLVAIVRRILESGHDPGERTYSGETALSFACARGHEKAASLLLEYGADATAFRYSDGWGPLHSAAAGEVQGEGCIVLLAKHGADIEAQTNAGETPLILAVRNSRYSATETLLKLGADTETNPHNTVLLFAAGESTYEFVHLLLRGGASVHAATAENETPLHRAAEAGNDGAVRALLEHGVDVEVRTKAGDTPLVVACRVPVSDEEGPAYAATVEWLLHYGAQVNAKATRGNALFYAAENGRDDLVGILLKAGADTGLLSTMTPLHAAASAGHASTVRLLLDGGAGADTMAVGFGTPLILASREGRYEVVEVLLAQGVDIEAHAIGTTLFHAEGTTLIHGGTALSQAAIQGHADIMRLLREAGADIEAQGVGGQTALCKAAFYGNEDCVRLLLDWGAQVEPAIDEDEMPIHFAAEGGNATIVQWLHQRGADIDAYTPSYPSGTPLHRAVHNHHLEVVRLLWELGAKLDVENREQRTPLGQAVWMGRVASAKVLVEAGSDVNAKGDLGNTALIWAITCRGGHAEIAWMLLEAGADANLVGDKGDAPIHYAAALGDGNIVKMLLQKGADAGAKDFYGITALSQAIRSGHEYVVSLLLDAHVDIETRDVDGWTPLHFAANANRSDLVEMLLERGADVQATDNSGATPLGVASTEGHSDVVQLLEEYAAGR